ncbi:MAG: hypothetical protein ACKVOU_12040 [Cytophagales bacterium]
MKEKQIDNEMEKRRDYFTLATLFGAGTIGFIISKHTDDFGIYIIIGGTALTVSLSAMYFQLNDKINQLLR